MIHGKEHIRGEAEGLIAGGPLYSTCASSE